MSWEQRNADFCKAQTDAGFAYIEAERRVKALEAENAKLQNTIDELRKLVRAMWLYDYAGKFSSAPDDVEHVAMVYQSMRKLGVEI